MKTNVTVELFHATGATGTTDPETGAFTPDADPAPYYTGRGFLIDEGAALEFDAAGAPTLISDAQLVLPKGTVARAHVAERDSVRATYANNDVVDAEIIRAVRVTNILQLRRA